jgi:hypothetical protein
MRPQGPRRRLDLATLRAAWWAHRAAAATRRSLRSQGLNGTRVAPPPALPDHARRGAASVLHRTRASCLERSMVLQAWDTAHGRRRDLVVGVTGPGQAFRAHAWLEGDPASSSAGFRVLFRRSAP